MKTCILRHAYFPDDPRERKHVNALLDAGVSIDVICLRKAGQTLFQKYRGANIYRLPLSHQRKGVARYFLEYALSFLMMGAWVTILAAIKRYSCIQVCTMPDFLVFATVLAKRFGCKIILDLHEPTPELWITKFGRKKLSLLFRIQVKIEQMAICYADSAITVTQTLRERFGERGADIKKIRVVSNVCEESVFNRSGSRPPTKNPSLKMITHGLIEERYGHELVIKAVANLAKTLPGLSYDILGGGEYADQIIQRVRDAGDGEAVRYLGFLPFDEMQEHLRNAEVGIIPMQRSPYSELIDTNKMYEFIAMGIPVIASRLPAIESNFDDTCIQFFEPGNIEDLSHCIVNLYHDSQRRAELAENAYNRYLNINWDKTKHSYIQTFLQLSQETHIPLEEVTSLQ